MKAVMNIDVELRSCIEIPNDLAKKISWDGAGKFAALVEEQIKEIYNDADVVAKVYRLEVVE